MDEERLAPALIAPTSLRAAEEWAESVIRSLGPRFRPVDGVDGYWLEGEDLTKLSDALAAARRLLGDRLDDLVYRAASEFLSAIDPEYSIWARPVSQPPARFWLIERPDTAGDVVELAFEDECGLWWLWEPTIDRFHNATPGLNTDFYYRAAARTDEWVDDGFGRFRFRKLTIPQVMVIVDNEMITSEEPMVRYLDGVLQITLAQAIAQVTRPGD